MGKLTKAQIDALSGIDRWGRSARIKLVVGEALRKRGLVTRYTTYIIKAVFANMLGEHTQYVCDVSAPRAVHEWSLTAARREALKREKGND